jgi:hypothetical protein
VLHAIDHDEESRTVEPRQHVGATQLPRQSPGDLDQAPVGPLAADGIGEGGEPVDVEMEQRQPRALAAAAGEAAQHAFLEECRAGQAGERVAQCVGQAFDFAALACPGEMERPHEVVSGQPVLADEILGTHGYRLGRDHEVVGAEAREDHDWHGRVAPLQPGEAVKSARVGQLEVEQDDVRRMLVDRPLRRGEAVGHAPLDARMVGEHRIDQGALGRAVLDDQQGERVGHGQGLTLGRARMTPFAPKPTRQQLKSG